MPDKRNIGQHNTEKVRYDNNKSIFVANKKARSGLVENENCIIACLFMVLVLANQSNLMLYYGNISVGVVDKRRMQ